MAIAMKGLINTLCLITSIVFTGNGIAKEIALTFDDAPMPGNHFMAGEEKTHRIITALSQQQVTGAMFFVTTSHIKTPSDSKRLTQYAKANHTLAHHSHHHGSLKTMSVEEYITDFEQADAILANYPNLARFHRFPYLQYGDSLEKRTAVINYLTQQNYQIGYVTIDSLDWYLNSKLLTARSENKTVNYQALKELYIETITSSIRFYESMANEHIRTPVKHVLLLHENELAALFVGDLVAHLKAHNWKIIAATDAFNDPILSNYSPNYRVNNQGRVAAIAHHKGVDERKLRSPTENSQYIDEQIILRKLFQ